MLERMTGWIGLLGNNEKKILREMSVGDAINAHMKWKAWLQDHVNGKSGEELDPATICRDDQCLLGRWIHDHAAEHFHRHGAFYTVRTRHAQFHLIAGEVAAKMRENNPAAAAELADTHMLRASQKLVYALLELDKQLLAEES